MILRYLKQQMLLPIKEYIINQRVNIRGIDVLILSFTIEKDENSLWMMYANQELYGDRFDDEYIVESRTNREKLLRGINASSKHKDLHIRQMEIQGHIVNFSSSSSSSIYNMDSEGIMRLQHFVESGLISNEWDDVKLENLVIAQYKQMDEEIAPNIDNTKELDIKLYVDRDSREISIQHPFKIQFGKQEMGTKIVYYDEELGKENYFFINEIYSFDVYEDIKKKVDKIEDVEMRGKNLEIFIEGLERIYPRDKNLAVIKYEAADNTQLNFHMKEYLEAEPIYSDSAIGIIWGSKEDEIGINGYKLRECVLQPIDKDFSGELEIELFSRFLEIPEETIESIG